MKPLLIVPDIDKFVRESTDTGAVKAIIKCLLHLNLKQLFKLIEHQLFNLPNLLQKDFAAAFILLTDIELLSHKLSSQPIFLNSKITDLALALDNQRLFVLYFKLIRRHYHLAAGLATNNLGFLVQKLGAWRLTPDAIKINPARLSDQDKKHLLLLPSNLPIFK